MKNGREWKGSDLVFPIQDQEYLFELMNDEKHIVIKNGATWSLSNRNKKSNVEKLCISNLIKICENGAKKKAEVKITMQQKAWFSLS